MSRPITEATLNDLVERAKRASEFDKENGDHWSINHSFILNRKNTVACPAFDSKTSMSGFPAYGLNIDPMRHIAGASPAMIMRLVAEIKRLRCEAANREAIDNGNKGEPCA